MTPTRLALTTLAALTLAACAKRAPSTSAPYDGPSGDKSYSTAESSADGGGYAPAAPSGASAVAGADYSEAADEGDWGAPEMEASEPAPSEEAFAMTDSDSAPVAVSSGRASRRAKRRAKRAKASSYDQRIQAGTLTAGTFDDTLNWGTFSSFMANMTQNPSVAVVAERFTGPMTTIVVTDAAGRPLPAASVELRAGQRDGRPLVTGTDGRAFAISGYDHGAGQLQVRAAGGAWTKVRPGSSVNLRTHANAAPIRALDVALVIDATGSMSDELEYLKVEVRSIVKEIKQEFPNVDQRFSVVVYRDQGDDYVTQHFSFSPELRQFEHWLGQQSADGGGDYPEAMDAALEITADLPWRTGADTARVAFLIADAPPHDQSMAPTMTAVEDLRSAGVAIYPVAASGVASEAEVVMRTSALMTGGQYLWLTDDSGVGNSHAEPHIPCYSVEALREAMTRMVLSELAGKRVEANPKRAVRNVGQSNAGVCAPLRMAR